MEVKGISKGQIGCIHALTSKLGLKAQKANLVLGFTNGRTESTGEMHMSEATEFIKYLKAQDPDEVKAERMRKKIISMAHECGYRKPGTTQVDMQRLDDWCCAYGKFHKKLNRHTVKELPELVTQFEARYKSFLSNI